MNNKFESVEVELIEIFFGHLSKEGSKDGGKDGGNDCITGMTKQNKDNGLEYLL